MEPEQPILNIYPPVQEMAIPIPSLHSTMSILDDLVDDTKICCNMGIGEETKKVTISFDVQIDGSHYESQINLTFDKTSGLITRLKNIENTINMKQRLAANAYRTASGQEFIENL